MADIPEETRKYLAEMGRKGGKKTGKKGFSAMDPAKRRAIQEKAWAKTRKKINGSETRP